MLNPLTGLVPEATVLSRLDTDAARSGVMTRDDESVASIFCDVGSRRWDAAHGGEHRIGHRRNAKRPRPRCRARWPMADVVAKGGIGRLR
eukprot:5913290-Prymnesium_polylepis.2